MEQILVESNQERIRSLAEQISLNHVIPYIGAGMSMPLFCGWSEYLKRICLPGALGGTNPIESGEILDYEEQAQWLYKHYPIRFVEETRKAFATDKIRMDRLNDSVKLLPKLFRGLMITTNLDQVLETVYEEESGIKLKVALAGETGFVQRNMEQNTPSLWKIHGDIEKEDEWVLTKDQYDYQYQDAKEQNGCRKGVISFQQLLSMYIQSNRLLFLGCSLDSDRIVKVMGKLFQKNKHIRHYAILPLPSLEKYAEYASRLENQGIQVIWYENQDKSHREVTQILQEVLGLVESRYTNDFGVPVCQDMLKLADVKKKLANR